MIETSEMDLWRSLKWDFYEKKKYLKFWINTIWSHSETIKLTCF